ncbi:MAG: hypothetical protein ACFFDO_04230 [Candidatus Thorarchaeota archaeon]
MSDVSGKEAAIGLLIIGLVVMAGWVGFLYVNPVTKTKKEEETVYVYITNEIPPTYESGLPDDWSTAPNASKIILFNETGAQVEITLEQILKYIEMWEETSQEKYWWEKRLQPITVNDPTGIPITGVDVLELLRVFDCNFAGELEFVSHNDTASKLTMEVIELSNIISDNKDVILGIAANKKWLKQSLIGERCGNFSIFGKDTTEGDEIEFACYDLANITVTKNWTITVNVYNNDDSLNSTLVLDAFNITNAYSGPYHYEYKNTAWWNFNRTYYGTNISQIVDYTNAKNTDYVLNITFSAGDVQPSNKTFRKIYSYSHNFNYTDVEYGFANDGTYVVGNHVDLVNGTTPMLKSNLLMCITNKLNYSYEHKDPFFNSPWDDFYNEGYPPFKFILPGAARSRYFNGVVGINIKILSSSR